MAAEKCFQEGLFFSLEGRTVQPSCRDLVTAGMRGDFCVSSWYQHGDERGEDKVLVTLGPEGERKRRSAG